MLVLDIYAVLAVVQDNA